MNVENSISLNFSAIMLEILEILKRFIYPKFHETLQSYLQVVNKMNSSGTFSCMQVVIVTLDINNFCLLFFNYIYVYKTQ